MSRAKGQIKETFKKNDQGGCPTFLYAKAQLKKNKLKRNNQIDSGILSEESRI
jgi:hypothetical protein